MLRDRVILAVTALLTLPASGLAQPSDISVDSSVNPEQIKEWLQSNDSRLVAWGAYFASKSDDPVNDDVYATIMARTMAKWVPPSRENHVVAGENESLQISREAMAATLDALIKKHVIVPAVSVKPIIPEFPTEALILASRLPPDEATPILEGWWEKRHQIQGIVHQPYSDPSVPYAFFVAMLLSKAPPPGFAASVLTEAEERLSFWVLDRAFADMESERFKGGGTPGGCREADQVPAPPSEVQHIWPPLFRYHLQNSSAPELAALLVDVGGERVYYHRISVWVKPSNCYQPLVSKDALHPVLAEMLRIDEKTMRWPVHQDVIHLWNGSEAFLSALTEQIESEESKFRAAIKTLKEEGYLTEIEAKTAQPKLVVVVNDARAPWSDGQGHDHSPLPLPRSVPPRSRISVSYDKR